MALRLDQPVGIDPCVDVVFAELFGAHERILVAFLNAVIEPVSPITRATVRSPIHSGAFEGQKAVVLDIEATDASGRILQVEMQRQAHRALAQRMLYLWARLYAEQLGEAASYTQLRPVVSVWICEQDPFPAAKKAHLRFSLGEVDERFVLHDDARLDILQLSRWARERESGASGLAASPLGAWFWFLTEAAEWRQVPAAIDTPILEEAMGVLNEFRTDVHKNALYRAQLDAERVAATVREEIEETAERLAEALVENARVLAEKEQERAAKEQERAAKEVALAELARLREKLADDEA